MPALARPRVIAPWLAVAFASPGAIAAEPATFRHEAPVVVEQRGTFVRLPVPASALARSRQPGLADLRLVDARGDRVPFAWLAPRGPAAPATESTRAAALYALPARRQGEAEPAGPLEVQVIGDRITVRRIGAPAAAGATGQIAPMAAPAPGWLFDLGEPVRDEAPATALRLAWTGPAEFSAAYELAVSDDLRQWRAAGGGQLLSLASAHVASGHLAQPDVPLPPVATSRPAARFVRLRWLDPAGAPRLSAAVQVRPVPGAVAIDPPTTLVLPPAADGAAGGSAAVAPAAPSSAVAQGALVFDLGAVLPLVEVDLQLDAAPRVAPVRVQGRAQAGEPWRDLGQTVFYRLTRGEAVDRSPPLALHASVRHLRLVPDPRSGPLPAVPLRVHVQLPSLVFAAQGEAPYRLLVGSADAAPGALPIASLVPRLDDERPRLGRAVLGEWKENEAVARDEAWRQRLAAWRPALLWAVLLAGVAGLGAMVWRLARRGVG